MDLKNYENPLMISLSSVPFLLALLNFACLVGDDLIFPNVKIIEYVEYGLYSSRLVFYLG